MSGANPQRIVKDMVEALNRRDLDGFMRPYAEDVVVRMMGRGESFRGRDAVRDWLAEAFDALDPFHNEVIGIYGDGATLVLEVVAKGTPVKEFMGHRPGENWEQPELYVYEFRGDRIAEVRSYT